MTENPITPTISLENDGANHGFLQLPHSRNDSAWGSVMIPITVIKNGDGPTALLTGANHGDEYEGPIALQYLANTINPSDVSGRIIMLPMMNFPAFAAGTRCSPIDGMNMNRSFPGKPDGSVTQKICHYVSTILLPEADVVLDFHSGGKTLDFLPFAAAHILADKKQEAACMAAMRAFNAPNSCQMLEIDNKGMLDTEAEAQGKIFVTTELGGAGTSTASSVAIAKRGALNLLRHSGILAGKLEKAKSVELAMPDNSCFLFAEYAGMIEYKCDLGARVSKGDVIAQIWSADRTGVAPIKCFAKRSGLLTGRHVPGLVQNGDFIALVAHIA